jgi:hypothetical protein
LVLKRNGNAKSLLAMIQRRSERSEKPANASAIKMAQPFFSRNANHLNRSERRQNATIANMPITKRSGVSQNVFLVGGSVAVNG